MPPSAQPDQLDASPIPMAKLVQLIVTTEVGPDEFQARPHGDWLGAFAHGGLVAAQALWSTAATVPDDMHVHSLHATFIGVGRSSEPLTVRVTRLRDGKSFATRTAEVVQDGRLILHLVSSFHREEPGPEYQLGMDAAVNPPEDVAPSTHPLMVRLRDLRDVEFREIGPTRPRADGTFRATRRAWVRVDAPLPDDPRVHACLFTVVSDIGTVMAARHPIMRGVAWLTVGAASLDHAIWFHRPLRADDWSLYEIQTVSAQSARSMIRGTFHSRNGELGLSVAQEVLIRPPSAAHRNG